MRGINVIIIIIIIIKELPYIVKAAPLQKELKEIKNDNNAVL